MKNCLIFIHILKQFAIWRSQYQYSVTFQTGTKKFGQLQYTSIMHSAKVRLKHVWSGHWPNEIRPFSINVIRSISIRSKYGFPIKVRRDTSLCNSGAIKADTRRV